jgi:hypothetical protein
MTEPAAEKWYLAATCKNPKCNELLLLMECPPPDVPIGVDREEFDYLCPFCKTHFHYTMHEVTRRQEATRH